MGASSITDFRGIVAKYQQASHPDIKLALVRIAGESREKLAASSPQSAEFFDGLRQTLIQLKGRANAELRIGCLFDCAKYFYVAGNVHKGASAARDGIALAKAIRNDTLTMKGYGHLGNALADSGDVAQGIEAFGNALELAQKNEDHEWHAILLINLGVAFLYAAQYHDAIACFDSADGLRDQLVEFQEPVRLYALSNKALCYLRLNRLSEGLVAFEKCIAETKPPATGPDLLQRLVLECNYAQLLLESGDHQTATKRLPFIKELAFKGGSQKARVVSAVVEGLIEVHRGDAARGLQLLQEARDTAQDVNSLVQDALIGLVRGHELLGQYARALECLQQLMQRMSVARRECALLHLRTYPDFGSNELMKQTSDLDVLRHREAHLRAKVAEERLAWSQIEMLERLAVTADLREEQTGEHGYRVGRLSAMLGDEIGMDAETCLAIDLAARLHDIGKIVVPDRILLASEHLKEAERHFMCQHTIMGAELLAKSDLPQLRLAEEIALNHHEWWNGTGYPRKIAGKRIPLPARIVALADVFDALTHGRPYADAWSMDRAREEIQRRRGTQFDPELTDRFLALITRLRNEHRDFDDFLAQAGRNSPFLQARRKIKLMLEQERENERRTTLPGNETRH